MGGHAFSARRAFDLATYCRAEAVPFHNCANPRVFRPPASVMFRRAYLRQSVSSLEHISARARPWARCEETS